MILFPFAEYWGFYLGFIAFVLGVLALDLGVFHRKAHEVSFKESSIWTLIWIGLALVFNYLFYLYVQMKFDALTAKQSALEFLTGYVVEKSLAIDNIFIFAVVFAYFGIPKKYQHRILFWGILGALLFRALFIALGSVLMTLSLLLDL
jgi:tellurite resistance protein TerC